jgi:hypothetical protein
MLLLPTLALLSSVISTVRALTVYGQIPLVHTMAVADATATATSGAPPVQTTLAAYGGRGAWAVDTPCRGWVLGFLD